MQSFIQPSHFLCALLFCLLMGSCAAQQSVTTAPDRAAQIPTSGIQQADNNPDRLAAIAQLEATVASGTATDFTNYLIGYGYADVAHHEQDPTKIDQWCARADAALDAVAEGSVAKDELLVARAYVSYGRIGVDIMTRGYPYSRKGMTYLNEALAINPDNPRAHFLTGQHFIKTPIQFGGDLDKACAANTRAVALFERNGAIAGISWGEVPAQRMQSANCGHLTETKKK